MCGALLDQSDFATARQNPGILAGAGEDHGCSPASNSHSDDVTRGLNNEPIIQRFRLVNKVALVTGERQVSE